MYAIILVLILIQTVSVILYFINFLKKYFFTHEKNLVTVYGKDKWVLITGCSSGQGKQFALGFAKRNFNIILVGNQGIKETEREILDTYKVKTICIICDFCKAYKKNFFKKIEKVLSHLPDNGELAVLVNNIGHRTAWNPYHEMPPEIIRNTIVCGTIVQSRLTQIAIQKFLTYKNTHKRSIINITAMCLYANPMFGQTGEISVPYMSVYEAANAFGFYHSNSIEKEYKDRVDVLNIIPGAVLTTNTFDMLQNVMFCVEEKVFVENVFKLIGNFTGVQHAHWKHELSSVLAGIYINPELLKVGRIISEKYMQKYRQSYLHKI
jgi:short-subunit dehydrogenase